MSILIDKDNLQKMANECSDRTEFAIALGYSYFNGRVSKKITEIVNQFDLSINHFDSAKKNKVRRKYPVIEKICPVCQFKFLTFLGSKEERRTCSYGCSNVYFASIRHTDESKKKASNSLIKFHKFNGTAEITYDKICAECLLPFQTIKDIQICCSLICASKLRSKNPETRMKLFLSVRKRIADGNHKGWAKRSNLEPSYPEKYVISLLNDLNIEYERELKVGKWFIDFSVPNRKLALEIDGKQHELPERKASDAIKDQYLIENGWQICRIKWKKITKEFRDELIYSISKFFIQGLVSTGAP